MIAGNSTGDSVVTVTVSAEMLIQLQMLLQDYLPLMVSTGASFASSLEIPVIVYLHGLCYTFVRYSSMKMQVQKLGLLRFIKFSWYVLY